MTNPAAHNAEVEKHFAACRVDLALMVSDLDAHWSLEHAMQSLWHDDPVLAKAIERLHGIADWRILDRRCEWLLLNEHHRVLGVDPGRCAVCLTRDATQQSPQHTRREPEGSAIAAAVAMRDPTWDLQAATTALRDRDPNLAIVFERLTTVADEFVEGRRDDLERLQAHHQDVGTSNEACDVCAASDARELIKQAKFQWKHAGLRLEPETLAARIMLADPSLRTCDSPGNRLDA